VPSESGPPQRITCLVADDHPALVAAVSDFLESQGFEVVGRSRDGVAAVADVKETKPDIALVDYRMPGLNGAETTSELLRASPGTRVVCLTASISHDEEEQLYGAGAVACLTKDEDLDQIVNAIREAAAGAARA